VAILFRDMHIAILLFICSMRFIRRVFLFAFEVCDKPFVKGMFSEYGGLNQLKKAPVYLIDVSTSAAQI
jgi:hypothetical protein